MASAGSIFVDLLLRDANYREGMRRSSKSTSDFQKGIKNLAKELAPILGAAGFTAIANKALDAADSISKLSQQLGLGVEEYQKYAYAVKLGGVDTEKFSAAIGYLNNQIAEGKVPYSDTSQALLDISDRLKNAKDGIERAGIASEAFGAKAGRVMIPALIKGSDEVRALGAEAERLGIIFSGQLAKDAEEFKDQIEILGTVFTNNFQIGLLEAFVGKSGEIRDIYTDPTFIDSIRTIGEVFGNLAKTLIKVAEGYGYATRALADFGIKVAERSGYIDPEVAKEALQIKDLSGEVPTPPLPSGGGDKGGYNKTLKEQEKIQKELESIYKRNRDVILGLDTATIQYMDSVEEIKRLLDANVISLDEYNDAVKRLDEELEKNREKTNEWGIDLEEIGKRAASNIQDAFADFLFDPFADGTKGMLKGFVDVVRRMVAEAQAAQLAKYLLGDLAGGSGGGLLGDVFGSVLGSATGSGSGFSLPFFADGGYLPAGQFGIAGEDGAELLYGGKTGVSVFNQKQVGGGDTYIDARGADMATVRRLEQIIYERTSRDAILSTVTQGQARGAL